MKNAQHTPGPWSIGKAHFSRENGAALDGDVTRLFMPGGVEVLVVSLGNNPEQIEADARLIAASPELLAALVGFQKAWNENRLVTSDEAAAIRSAIAKATGAA
jgi:hypothetical protein